MKRTLSGILFVLLLTSLAAAALLATGCGRHIAPDWYIITGSATADPAYPAGQRRLMALQGAKADAHRQLLEAAKGVRINSNTTVRDFMTQSDVIESQVSGIIRGAQVVGEPRYLSDGSVEIDMRIDMNRVRDIVR